MQLIAEQLRNGQIDLSESLRRMGEEYRGEMSSFLHRCAHQAESYEVDIERMGEEIVSLEIELNDRPSQSSYDRMEDRYNVERMQCKNSVLESRVLELETELKKTLP